MRLPGSKARDLIINPRPKRKGKGKGKGWTEGPAKATLPTGQRGGGYDRGLTAGGDIKGYGRAEDAPLGIPEPGRPGVRKITLPHPATPPTKSRKRKK